MIESGMVPVIVTVDATAQAAVEDLSKPSIPSGAIARRLQAHLVQVPRSARARLIECGHVAFIEKASRSDQFAVLLSKSLYQQDVGLGSVDIWVCATD
jgi:CRISPR-associated endonuclease/helicase Cas3